MATLLEMHDRLITFGSEWDFVEQRSPLKERKFAAFALQTENGPNVFFREIALRRIYDRYIEREYITQEDRDQVAVEINGETDIYDAEQLFNYIGSAPCQDKNIFYSPMTLIEHARDICRDIAEPGMIEHNGEVQQVLLPEDRLPKGTPPVVYAKADPTTGEWKVLLANRWVSLDQILKT